MKPHRCPVRRLAGVVLLGVPLASAQETRDLVSARHPDAVEPRAVPGTRRVDQQALLGPGIDVFPGTDDNGLPLVFDLTRVAANGVSLRQCTSGAINLVGVPPGSVIVRAFLYWQWIALPAPVAGLQDTLFFGQVPGTMPTPGGGWTFPVHLRRKKVVGNLVGSGLDPCWVPGTMNFTYRADVTKLVQGGATYVVWLPTGAAPAADWTDPFSQFVSAPGPYCEGASLVVVYQHPSEPPGTTIVYDTGLAGTMFTANPGLSWNLTSFVAPGSESRWINIAGDGQTGAGYGDVPGLGYEQTVFQGWALAGGGAGTPITSFYNDSDWNGSGNKPVGQLWDTSGHEVSFNLPAGSTSATILVFDPSGSPMSDCLVPVANVLWIR